MKLILKTGFLVTALALSAGSFMTPASAATVECSAAIATKVTNTSVCEVSDTAKQDFLNGNPMTVNAEKFFGIDTWAFIRKDDNPADGQSGSWSLASSDWTMFDTIMLIFKSGNGTFLTGYLAVADAVSGTWDSPFAIINPKNGKVKTKDVSHVSYYGANTPATPVPLPAASWLLITALGGLGAAAWRRRKSS